MKLFFSSLLATVALFSGTAQADALEKSMERELCGGGGGGCEEPCEYNGDESSLTYVSTNLDEDTGELTATWTAGPLTNDNSDTFGVIVFPSDGTDCDLTRIIGAGGNYDLIGVGTTTLETPQLVFLTVGTTGTFTITLNVDHPDFDDFEDDGSDGYSESGTTGTWNFCVQMQQFACGIKVDFEEIQYTITYDLESECETCVDGTITRDDPTDVDAGQVNAPILDCYFESDTSVGNGDQMTVCVEYRSNDLGWCFADVTNFEVTFDGDEYQLAEAGDGVAVGDPAVLIASNECSVDFDDEESDVKCCITFLPPQPLIQALPLEESITVEAFITVLSSLNTCAPNPSLRRDLQSGGKLSSVSRSFKVTKKEEVEGDTCSGFFGCFIQTITNILKTIFWFLG